MGTLILVRHGQASFGEANYDKLSAKGEQQARKLGEHWARRGVVLDALYTGPRERQKRTAEIAREAAREAGASWPEPSILPELDEMAAEDLLKRHVPRLVEEHPELATMVQELMAATDHASRVRRFQKVLERVSGMWVRGEFVAPDIEPWGEFVARVGRALAAMRAGDAKGRRVAAFTSGGPVGATMQLALDTPPEIAINLAWMVKNASTTELLFTQGKLTLSSFNLLEHLDSAELWTYR